MSAARQPQNSSTQGGAMSNSESDPNRPGNEVTEGQRLVLEKDPVVWNSLALVYLMSGEIERAQDAIQRSLEIDTSISATWGLWGRILECANDCKNAERAYRMAVELEPESTEARYRIALLRMHRQDLVGAMDDLSRILEISPSDQRIWDSVTECSAALVI